MIFNSFKNKFNRKYSSFFNTSDFVKKEAFEKIRANIEFLNFANDIKSILVTSSIPNEGKSTVAFNTSIAIAGSGKKTLLLDADMRISVLHRNFGFLNDVGLSDAILSPKDYKDFIKPTEYENLDFMSAGNTPPNPSTLLSSKNMFLLLQNLKETYDLVIIDTPPVLAVADTISLSKYVDAVMFVARQDVSTKENVKAARDALNLVNANVIGTVINDMKISASKYSKYANRYNIGLEEINI